MTASISRDQIVERLESICRQTDSILAAWEGGSAAFGRDDGLSDIDLVVVTDQGDVAEAFSLIESALEELSPISDRFRLPEPTWHSHAQAFYRLRDAAPDHFVDLVVMRRDAPEKFLEVERHGRARTIIDRVGVETPAPLDRDATHAENRGRAASIAVRHRILGVLPGKELRRGRPIDAWAFYQSITVRHLVELLRIRHDPFRATFGLRYLDHDLPSDIRARLEPLLFVASAEDLAEKLPRAERWIETLLDPATR